MSSLSDRMKDTTGMVVSDSGVSAQMSEERDLEARRMFELFLKDTGASRNPAEWTQEQSEQWSALSTLFRARWADQIEAAEQDSSGA